VSWQNLTNPEIPAHQENQARRSIRHDFCADARVGENLQQQAVLDVTADHVDFSNAALHCGNGGEDFGDHAASDDFLLDEAFDLVEIIVGLIFLLSVSSTISIAVALVNR
jgi:hypothetical protein